MGALPLTAARPLLPIEAEVEAGVGVEVGAGAGAGAGVGVRARVGAGAGAGAGVGRVGAVAHIHFHLLSHIGSQRGVSVAATAGVAAEARRPLSLLPPTQGALSLLFAL